MDLEPPKKKIKLSNDDNNNENNKDTNKKILKKLK
tara:strand:- start:7392 stop:7496 length:105 start_codon:yes stop_codon:yes gene_type:complete